MPECFIVDKQAKNEKCTIIMIKHLTIYEKYYTMDMGF